MAIDFNGTISKLEHTTASGFDSSTLTVCVWVFADNKGEGNIGHVFMNPEGTNTFRLNYENIASPDFFLNQAFSTTAAEFVWPLSTGVWHALAVSYDRSSDANVPVVRDNFASVSVTTRTAPVGTFTAPATGYCVGNNTTQTRTWNGGIAHVQFFNVILAANEMDMALRRPGSVTRGRVLWLPMYHSGHVQDWSGSALNGTATSLGTRDGPPCQAPWSDDYFGWRGAFTAAAAANTWPGYYQSKGGWF